MKIIVVVALLVGMTLALPHQPRAATCGYESCPKAQPGKLNVHLVPHSHNDVGWLKTVDQYYYGSKNNIQNAGIQYILDSVMDALSRNPERKFIWVEMSFFYKWWVEQTPEQQERVKGLVNNGQLEFIGGGWTMNDEASTHYQTTIDQFTYAFRKLNETFGVCGQPKVGWQIDPFGHSREQASLMAQYGFDGLFFARLDYQDKDNRVKTKTMEMIWETSPSLGASNDLFTQVLNQHYSTPAGGFCWDDNCGDDPIIDNPNIPDYNVPDRVDTFINAMHAQAARYRSENILVVFGDDFQYKSAHKNFKNIDKLISQTDIFGHGLYHEYRNPPGFCFDVLCTDDPIIDDPESPDNNIQQKVDDFISWSKTQGEGYRSNNIILTMGEDFYYQNANQQFKNLDKLIRYVNERQADGSDVNVFYSTPSCYLKSVNEAKMSWPTKQDDFFPYASDSNAYWTGYFTSRPTLKFFERQGNNILQAGKQLAAITAKDSSNLEEMQSAMGIMQHHDAITGTEKQAVSDDYARILHKATVGTEEVIFSALNTLLGNGQNVPALQLESCRFRNISQCALTAEKESFLVTIYNPLSRSVDYFVRLPVADATYTVVGPDGKEILTQLLPIPDQLAAFPGRDARTTQELVFTASQLPPIGYRSYIVTRDAQKRESATSRVWKPKRNEEVTIGDKDTKITLDARSKFLKSISTKAETYDVKQSLQYYISHDGDNNGAQNRASGAYIFRPTTKDPMPISDEADTQVIEGDVVHEVHQVFSNWASQIIRHYNNQPVVEFEWLVGPIPVDDNQGREVISKFTTTIPTNSLFYTDTNGREVIQRRKDYRPTWDLQVNEPTSGNYYPIATHISFANATSGLAIVTDRGQGGSSMYDGSLELMVHRRCLHDDAFGAGEALNEQQYGQGLVARGRHFVLIGQTNSTVSPREIRLLETRKVLDSLVVLSDVTGKTPGDLQSQYRLEYSGLTKALPEQVQLLTLEPWREGSLLLRLEHLFTREEDSTTVSVDLTNLLADYEITAAIETNLAANKRIEETTRLSWDKESNEVPKYSPKAKLPLALDAVDLEPKQIRTFIVDVTAKKSANK